MYARRQTEDLADLCDSELLHRAKDGDYDSISELLARHSDALFLYCCRLTSNRFDAEDICQEAMIRAMRGVESLESASAFRSWLYRIARNVSVDSFRRMQRLESMPDGDFATFPSHEVGPDEVVEASEEHEMVARALSTLKQSHQKVLLLREVEGMSYADIARHLDVSQSAVETLLFRARRRLREQYSKATSTRLVLVAPLRSIAFRLSGPTAEGTHLAAKLIGVATFVGVGAVTLPHISQIELGGTQLALAAQAVGGTVNAHVLSGAQGTGVSRPSPAFLQSQKQEVVRAPGKLVTRPRLSTLHLSVPAAHSSASRRISDVHASLDRSSGSTSVASATHTLPRPSGARSLTRNDRPSSATRYVPSDFPVTTAGITAISDVRAHHAAPLNLAPTVVNGGLISPPFPQTATIAARTHGAKPQPPVLAWDSPHAIHAPHMPANGGHQGTEKTPRGQSGQPASPNQQSVGKRPVKTSVSQPSPPSHQHGNTSSTKSISAQSIGVDGQAHAYRSTANATRKTSVVQVSGGSAGRSTVKAQSIPVHALGGGDEPVGNAAQPPAGRAQPGRVNPATPQAQSGPSRGASGKSSAPLAGQAIPTPGAAVPTRMPELPTPSPTQVAASPGHGTNVASPGRPEPSPQAVQKVRSGTPASSQGKVPVQSPVAVPTSAPTGHRPKTKTP